MELVELAHLVDQFETARDERLAADKVAAELKSLEAELQRKITAAMLEDGVGMVGGSRKRVTLRTSLVPHATDWGAIRDYITESGNWQLMHKRLSGPAYLELACELGQLPGIESIEVHKLSVAKL